MSFEAAGPLEVLLGLLLIGFLLSGIDDLAFDVLYWGRRLLRGPFDSDIALTKLTTIPERRVAIFLPAWQEEDVVWDTLLYNGKVIDYENYDFFVGTYPNDVATRRCVDMIREWLPNVHGAVNPRPGPSTKADNLNSIVAAMKRRETKLGIRYDFIVLHDAEDVFHPLELKLLNYHFTTGDADLIQTPIFPLPVSPRDFTAGTYMDQFAEVQTKDLHVRSAIRGFVPSCGVATGISRHALDRLEERSPDGHPFDGDALTEDYEVGMKLTFSGLRGVYVRQRVVEEIGDRDFQANPVTPHPEWVATWASFPHCVKAAVRQRTRWSLGIVFQSRRHSSFGQRLLDRWLLFHDRKAIWTYPLVALGYLLVLFLLLASLARRTVAPDLPQFGTLPGWIWVATTITALLFVNRLAQRMLAVRRIYGLEQGLLAIVRQPWDNLISISALARAAYQFTRARFSGQALAWDKTAHVAPSILRPRIGELLVNNGWLTRDQLQAALKLQREKPKPLGEILVELGHITTAERDEALAGQSNLRHAG